MRLLVSLVDGSDAALDEAIAKMPKIEQFLAQSPADKVKLEETVGLLQRVVS